MHQHRARLAVEHEHRRQLLRAGAAGGIGEDDDRCLETLGAVHRHDANAATGLDEVALDRNVLRPHFGEKALQRRQRRLLVRQGQLEERGDHVIDLAAKPAMEAPQPALTIQHLGVELEGPTEIEPPTPAGEPLVRRPRHRQGAGGEGLPQRLPRRPGGGDGKEIVLGDVEQWRAQQGGKLQAVGRIGQHVAEREEIQYGDVGGDRQPVRTRRRDTLLA